MSGELLRDKSKFNIVNLFLLIILLAINVQSLSKIVLDRKTLMYHKIIISSYFGKLEVLPHQHSSLFLSCWHVLFFSLYIQDKQPIILVKQNAKLSRAGFACRRYVIMLIYKIGIFTVKIGFFSRPIYQKQSAYSKKQTLNNRKK